MSRNDVRGLYDDAVAKVGSPLLYRLHGFLHRRLLIPLSEWYRRWKGLPKIPGILPLPFNLILKFSDKLRIDEAVAMCTARGMGIPVPRFIAYGAPDLTEDLPSATILMTCVPGKPLNEVVDTLTASEMDTIRKELLTHIERMRAYSSPWGDKVCSVTGGPVTGLYIPDGHVGPCGDEDDFHAIFLAFGNNPYWNRKRPLDEVVATAKGLLDVKHQIKFTHGDLLSHNIMISEGHISGIIDWEWAGWFPEYWEHYYMIRGPIGEYNGWWSRFVRSMGLPYEREVHCANAMWYLASDSFTW